MWGLIGVFVGCSASTSPVSSPWTAAALEQATRDLTQIGPRMVGTVQEQQAADAMRAALLDAGLRDVEPWGFTWDAWQPGWAEIRAGDGEAGCGCG